MTRILTLDEKVPSLLAATLTDKPIASLGYNKAYETAALFILSCNNQKPEGWAKLVLTGKGFVPSVQQKASQNIKGKTFLEVIPFLRNG